MITNRLSIRNALTLAEHYSMLRTICIINIITIGYTLKRLITAIKVHDDILFCSLMFLVAIQFQIVFIIFFRKTKKEYDIEKHRNRRV